MSHKTSEHLLIGLDVGSTTVKAVVIDTSTDEILWYDYQRHETRQHHKVLEFLYSIEDSFKDQSNRFRIFITGSGGRTIAPFIGARFVQEVNAVSLAVEKLHPETGSVIELGGQDAKIIIWVEDSENSNKRKLSSMNDKCAGGTGAVIDKIGAKLNLSHKDISTLRYKDTRLHPVAGKCGVFAETDINSLQKQGIPPEELMASLFEAIVQQNLSVLTRGNTLRHHVLLLGGPNAFIPALQEAWQFHIPRMWNERGIPIPEDARVGDLIYVPSNAQYYAAIGAVIYGKSESDDAGVYKGTKELKEYLSGGHKRPTPRGGMIGLAASREELSRFIEEFRKEPFSPPGFLHGEVVKAYIGIDGGSTSTKGVLLNREGELLARSYKLSKGNPIDDMREILRDLRGQVESQGAYLEVMGVGTTGYAKDMLKECFNADVALVETVAHTRSALHYFSDIDVIVDVGGQDIKVIFLKDGKVRDFKLNTQCSAGNGYFLQNTAERFGFDVSEYAELAFKAERMPMFHYGCAVFLESDIVNFQQQGWEREEIMAGLAHVLPKNIWLYVVQEPNLRRLGRTFVLQGGTQHNLAAVKSQYDFIKSRVPDAVIYVHKYTGESGAIGAALEAVHVVKDGKTRFVGLDAAEMVRFTALRDEATRCRFCQNNCQRTFIDIKTPLYSHSRRYIIATCEKGMAEDVKGVQEIKKRAEDLKKRYPDLSEMASKEVFSSRIARPTVVSAPKLQISNETSMSSRPTKDNENVVAGYPLRPYDPLHWPSAAMGTPAMGGIGPGFSDENRDVDVGQGFSLAYATLKGCSTTIKIGIPRTLNMYSVAPFFIAYFESLGIPYKDIIFSDYTDEKMYKEGSRRGAIDACFPSKVALSHIHNLLYRKDRPDVIFFPILLNLPTELKNTIASATCPTVAATPEVVKAAFTKEEDTFLKHGVKFLNPHLNMGEPDLFERQMYQFASKLFGISRLENRGAIDAGFKAQREYSERLRQKGKEILQRIKEEGKVGVVVLGRPYHNDPGLNHGILAEIQKYGYPIFIIDSLPVDKEMLNRLFGNETLTSQGLTKGHENPSPLPSPTLTLSHPRHPIMGGGKKGGGEGKGEGGFSGEIRGGDINDPMEITDVWKNSYSENTNKKLWGAKYVARHPNLVAVDLSNFRCGHDAPVYSVVEEILSATHTPYFTFHDIDENRPSGSIKIRVETIHYFLQRYEEELKKRIRCHPAPEPCAELVSALFQGISGSQEMPKQS